MDQIDKLKRGLRHCARDKASCAGCVFEGDLDCIGKRSRESLEVITMLEEQNKELREANERLLEQLKAARELGQNGVPPMPCKVGDTLWVVFKSDGVISVEKTECQAVLWDGAEWLVSENITDGYSLDGDGMFLSIEAAVKKAEEMLRNGND